MMKSTTNVFGQPLSSLMSMFLYMSLNNSSLVFPVRINGLLPFRIHENVRVHENDVGERKHHILVTISCVRIPLFLMAISKHKTTINYMTKKFERRK